MRGIVPKKEGDMLGSWGGSGASPSCLQSLWVSGLQKIFIPKMRGIAEKLCSARWSTTFLPTKCHTFCGKVPHSLQQSTTLPLTKYRFAALESRPHRSRKPSSSVTKAVLASHESRPRQSSTVLCSPYSSNNFLIFSTSSSRSLGMTPASANCFKSFRNESFNSDLYWR